MKLPMLHIDTTRVVRMERDALHGGDPTPVGQVFAFYLDPLLEAASAMTPDDLSLHELLLEISIEGLWQMRTKHPVLVGYIPGSDDVPVVRLFLLSRRELPFGKFTAAVARRPGYMESGQGFIRGSRTVPLAYWEYPCSAYALWSVSPEGVPFLYNELAGFESAGARYWMIHREFEFVSPRYLGKGTGQRVSRISSRAICDVPLFPSLLPLENSAMLKSTWHWEEGSVDSSREHLEIVYGDVNSQNPGEWIPVALVSAPKDATFSVQFLIETTDPESRKIVDAVREELDFYLVEKGEPDPWNYAKYHCGTTANVYSKVHWSYHPMPQPAESLVRRQEESSAAQDVELRERRTRQFEHHLGLMEHRTLHVVKSDCFIVFAVPAPREIQPRIGGSETRIVQFAFMENGFYLDLPDTTLTLEEAKRTVAERPGFGFALNNPQKRLGERQYDPVQRQYQYAEKRTASEDAAYVFFDLWQTPLDAWIDVDASAFEVERRWEQNFSMG